MLKHVSNLIKHVINALENVNNILLASKVCKLTAFQRQRLCQANIQVSYQILLI